MNRILTCGASLAMALSSSTAFSAELPADYVLTGGTFYTVDGENRVAEAMAVRSGTIVYVGDVSGVAGYIGPKTEQRDMKGRVIFPGFTDSHAHLPDGGGTILGLGLAGLTSAEAVLSTVKAYADAHPDMPVIVGAGWELSLFPEANPSKEMLDEIVSDRPVFLTAADGHNGWTNTAMLELAGVTADTEDPENGRIERDEAGNPTGTFREAAMGLFAAYIPQPSLTEVSKNLRAGIAYQLKNGITATIDAAIMNDVNEKAYLEAAPDKDLPQRVRISLLAADEMVTSNITEENALGAVARLEKRRAAYRNATAGRIDAEAVKIFVDGVPENHTAAMLEPYIDAPLGPDHRGEPNLSEAALDKYVTALEAADFQVHMHAIGDRAVRMALDALETAKESNGERSRRHQIAHLEIVQPEDIARFAPLGVSADMQSLWHYRDAYITDLTEPFLAEKLHRWLYPARSFKNAGARLVWGSDWPVSTSDPFDSMEVAVLRRDPYTNEGETWNEAETLTVDDMIHALTMGGAYLMGQEDIRGSLEVGKRADFIVIDADPYKIDPSAISDISVIATYVDGRRVYSSSE